MRYFSSVGEISTFKRYFNCILHVECSASRFQRRNRHSCSQIVTIYIILTKTVRCFSSVGGISTSNRYFNCILHVECSARRFQLRNRHSCSQIVTIYIILKKTVRCFSSVGGISTSKRYFNCILHVECSASRFQRRNRHSCSQIVTIYIILKKTVRCFSSVGGISTSKRYFNCSLHTECSASRF